MKTSLEHWEEDPSLNTTRNVLSQIDFIDMVLHIGDIAYAVGYSAQVLVFIYLELNGSGMNLWIRLHP